MVKPTGLLGLITRNLINSAQTLEILEGILGLLIEIFSIFKTRTEIPA